MYHVLQLITCCLQPAVVSLADVVSYLKCCFLIGIIGHFRKINTQLDSEGERTKTIETSCNECERISLSPTFLCLSPLNLSWHIEEGSVNLPRALPL